jgi:hypothetical protein
MMRKMRNASGLKLMLAAQISRLIESGVSTFYTGKALDRPVVRRDRADKKRIILMSG